jgi:hypothetical protein
MDSDRHQKLDAYGDTVTRKYHQHPHDFDWPCDCGTCQSYAE